MMVLTFLAIVGVVASVHDGDTLRLADGTRIRLQGIDANELDGSCHVECAVRSATEARDSLRALALGKTVSVDPTGRSYDRITGWVSVAGRDLSCAQVKGGYAIRWARYDREGRLLKCQPRKADHGLR
ncbi:thermonuclease family protein [Sphingomonas sp.]|uniref:thermonuclease family protein n=1 Tax=Sphingomonas sp. TaxID=28214 RepID=UPI003B3B3866